MISKKFLQSSVLYTIGGAMPMASGLVLLPFYTDLLAVETYGVLMLYVAFSLFVQVLTTYALDAYLGIHYIEQRHDAQKVKQLIASVSGLMLLLGVAWVGAAWLGGQFVFNLSFNLEGNLNFFPWGFWSVLVGVFNGIFKVATNLLVYRQEPMKYLLFNSINFILTIGISLWGLFAYPGELTGPMYGRLFSGIGIFILAIVYLIVNYGISFQVNALKGLNKFCFPYVIYLVFVWLLANADRYIINNTLNASTVGLYDFALRCTMLIELLQNGLMAAVNPTVFNLWKEKGSIQGYSETNRYFSGFTAISILLAATFSIAVPLMLPFIVKNEAYYYTFQFMCVLAASYALRGVYHYFLSPLLYEKKTHLLPIVFAISACIQLPLNYMLSVQLQLNGAIIANVLAKILQVMVLWLFVRRFFTYRVNSFKIIIIPAVYVGIQTLVWLQFEHFNLWLQVAIFVITNGLLALAYRNEIKLILARYARK